MWKYIAYFGVRSGILTYTDMHTLKDILSDLVLVSDTWLIMIHWDISCQHLLAAIPDFQQLTDKTATSHVHHFLCSFPGSPRESATGEINVVSRTSWYRQEHVGPCHLYRDRRQPVRSNRHQSCGQIPRQRWAQVTYPHDIQGWLCCSFTRLYSS